MSDLKTQLTDEILWLQTELAALSEQVQGMVSFPPKNLVEMRDFHLVQNYYFGSKTELRYAIQPGPLPWIAKTRPRENFEINQISERLGVSTRQVRRYLSELHDQGKTPAFWKKGRIWHPPIEEAVCAIEKFVNAKRHRPHTREATDPFVTELLRLKDQRIELQRKLSSLQTVRDTCQQFSDSTWTAKAGEETESTKRWQRLQRHNEKCFAAMHRVAGERGWNFCILLANFCHAMNSRTKKPTEDVATRSASSKRTFYRKFKGLISGPNGAAAIARRIVETPDALFGITAENGIDSGSTEIDEVMADWQTKVNAKDLYFEVKK